MGLNKDFQKQFTKTINTIAGEVSAAATPSLMKQIGEEAARLIYVRTKLGYGVKNNNGTRQKLRPLNPFYIAVRKVVKGGNAKKIKQIYQETGIRPPSKLPTGLDETTTPAKSNLTFSGQMLKSIKVKTTKQNEVIIGPQGYRNDGLTNEQVANSVQKFGRPFMFLSNLEIGKLKRFAKNGFSSIFKERFKRIRGAIF